jgi:hypothetical protein
MEAGAPAREDTEGLALVRLRTTVRCSVLGAIIKLVGNTERDREAILL